MMFIIQAQRVCFHRACMHIRETVLNIEYHKMQLSPTGKQSESLDDDDESVCKSDVKVEAPPLPFHHSVLQPSSSSSKLFLLVSKSQRIVVLRQTGSGLIGSETIKYVFSISFINFAQTCSNKKYKTLFLSEDQKVELVIQLFSRKREH